MSNNSDKIKQFFLDTILRNHSGLSEAYRNKINSFSDEELKVEYSELKSISERKGTIANSLILVLFLAFLGGLYKVFVDFADEVTKAYGLSNETYVLVNGLFILSMVIFIIVLFFIVFYLFRVSEKKKRFYYVEVLMKERGLL
ncbi:hypothetical protein [Streptococcus oralis]|uniref:hypothetical protein n=1 Tax=Streptococcus oralis TaxID=1303 RepID=UPI000A0F428E|nr:hypothetical protein [Streptococcus oralis]ORO81981.1 hypothetical protein B7704_06075 [Streptococcus oralis subsp. dentisani]